MDAQETEFYRGALQVTEFEKAVVKMEGFIRFMNKEFWTESELDRANKALKQLQHVRNNLDFLGV